jgi:YidC/Oxa1 family membrane protein insertase
MSVPLLDAAVGAAYPLVIRLTTLPGGAAAAIVLCTAALRLALHPLTRAAVRGERRRARLAPQVRELRSRYARRPDKLRAELAALYADTSPLAGLLPLLAQAPFFLILYRTFTAPRIAGAPNGLLQHTFLGAPLSTHLAGDVLVFVPLLLVLAAVAAVTARRATRIAAATDAPRPPGAGILPYASLLSATFLPLAAVLYLATTLSWTAAENVLLRRGYPQP